MKKGFSACVPIDKVIMNSVTTDTEGDAMDFIYNKQPTIVVTSKNIVGNGARLVAEGSADGVEYGLLDMVGGGGDLATHLKLDANITYIREIINASSIRWIRFSIVDYVDGTHTVTILAGTKGG